MSKTKVAINYTLTELDSQRKAISIQRVNLDILCTQSTRDVFCFRFDFLCCFAADRADTVAINIYTIYTAN